MRWNEKGTTYVISGNLLDTLIKIAEEDDDAIPWVVYRQLVKIRERRNK